MLQVLLLFPILTAIVYGEWDTCICRISLLFCIVAVALLRGKKPENYNYLRLCECCSLLEGICEYSVVRQRGTACIF